MERWERIWDCVNALLLIFLYPLVLAFIADCFSAWDSCYYNNWLPNDFRSLKHIIWLYFPSLPGKPDLKFALNEILDYRIFYVSMLSLSVNLDSWDWIWFSSVMRWEGWVAVAMCPPVAACWLPTSSASPVVTRELSLPFPAMWTACRSQRSGASRPPKCVFPLRILSFCILFGRAAILEMGIV